MKKKVLLLGLIFSLVFIVLISSLVSAQWYGDLRGAGEQVIQWIKDIFTPFLEVLLGTSVKEYFFEKVLFFILLYIIILSALKRVEIFKKNPFVYILISAIVSILGVRYLTEISFVQFILIPYGVFSIAALVFLPFFLFFFFVNSFESTFARRLGWILFALVYIALWIKNKDKIGDLSWIYWIGIILITLSFIFSDKIKQYFNLRRHKKYSNEAINDAIAHHQKIIQDYRDIDTLEAKRMVERAEERIKELEKQKSWF